MLVNFQGKTLWVEGDDAYSVDEVKSRHAELNELILKCESDARNENIYLQEHTMLRDKALRDRELYTEELKGIDFILEKVHKAENGLELQKVATPITDAKLEVAPNKDATFNKSAKEVEVGAESLKKSNPTNVFGRRLRV